MDEIGITAALDCLTIAYIGHDSGGVPSGVQQPAGPRAAL
jgi:hypothetical protein